MCVKTMCKTNCKGVINKCNKVDMGRIKFPQFVSRFNSIVYR